MFCKSYLLYLDILILMGLGYEVVSFVFIVIIKWDYLICSVLFLRIFFVFEKLNLINILESKFNFEYFKKGFSYIKRFLRKIVL